MKKCLLLFLAICISHTAFAQATDLVVDCQTPGWLSSKINYRDQQTVQNLKVTGYLNDDDIKFIGTLIMMNLHGVLDLGDASMVNNSLDGNFGLPATGGVFHYPLQKMIFPKSLESYNGWDINMKADSVVFDTKISVITNSFFRGTNIQHLILGENVTTVNGYATPHYLYFKSIHLPSSLITIQDFAFNNGLNDLSSSNISEFPNLEFIGYLAFVNDQTSSSNPPQRNRETLPDTIKFPKIKEYSVAAFDYKEGMHIYLGEDVTNVYPKSKNVYSTDWMPSLKNVTFHIAAVTPPSTSGDRWNNGLKVYVPKEAVETYKAHYGWKYANIIAEPKPLEQIELTEHEIAIEVDEQHQLTANPIPANADDITIIWSSDNEQVVTVSETGLVKAIARGEANITASSVDGTIKDVCNVLVKTHAESVSLQTTSIGLVNIGDTYQLEATVLPENAIDKTVTWKSANEQVCTVSNSGLVTATGIGSTLVTATTVDGGLTATCVVKVLQHVDGLTLNKSTLTLKVGENEDLQATITPSNADNKNVLWSSANDQIATVSNEGNVTAVKAGEVIVTATSEDNPDAKATCKIIVVQPVTGINISESTCLLHGIGESAQLTATVLPADASNKTIKWSSSNEGVCMVSNGTVVSTGFGTAVVIATTEDGGFMAYCTVTVESVTGIEEINTDTQNDTNYFSPDGKRINTLQRGINIIRKKDGTIMKVIR